MKRIIDGVTYNTDTSTRIAASEYDGEYNFESRDCKAVLYQTRGGAFFVQETVKLDWNEREEAFDERHRFRALSIDQAREWILGWRGSGAVPRCLWRAA